MIQYMPGTGLIQHGINAGDLDRTEIERLMKGLHDNYMSMGSFINKPERLRLLNGYRVMLRLMSFLPPRAKKLMLAMKAYKIFWMAPFRIFITVLDLMIAIRDVDATTYAKNYWWWFKKRFDPKYHLYRSKKRIELEELSGAPFGIPADGVLGEKTSQGWDTSRKPSVMTFGGKSA